MREIRMLRARWRGLETEPRTSLNGHEGGNPGYGQGMSYGPPRQPRTLPGSAPRGRRHRFCCGGGVGPTPLACANPRFRNSGFRKVKPFAGNFTHES